MNGAAANVRWVSEQLDADFTGFRVGHDGDDLVAEFIGIGLLRSDREARRVAFVPAPDADPEIVEKVRVSLVPALLRHARGELALHAGAVEMHGVAVSFVGESGAGKSSMAAYLCEHHDATFLGDDTTAIDFVGDRAMAVPTEPMHWLVEGSPLPGDPDGTKTPVMPRARASSPSRLAAICKLVFDASASAPRLTRVRGHAAMGILVPSIIRFVVDEPEAQTWELDALTKLCAATSIFQLARPRGTDYIRPAATLIEALTMRNQEEGAKREGSGGGV